MSGNHPAGDTVARFWETLQAYQRKRKRLFDFAGDEPKAVLLYTEPLHEDFPSMTDGSFLSQLGPLAFAAMVRQDEVSPTAASLHSVR
jgi:hypothetical protein